MTVSYLPDVISSRAISDLVAFTFQQLAKEPPGQPDHQVILEAIVDIHKAGRILRAAAQRWDDQPDYREEWRP